MVQLNHYQVKRMNKLSYQLRSCTGYDMSSYHSAYVIADAGTRYHPAPCSNHTPPSPHLQKLPPTRVPLSLARALTRVQTLHLLCVCVCKGLSVRKGVSVHASVKSMIVACTNRCFGVQGVSKFSLV